MEDDTTMRTIILRGFRNPTGRNIRAQAQSLKQIREAGRDPGISFTVLTPPRFAPQRRILAEIGHRMKRQEEISRYQFVIKQGNLWMKVSKQGQASRLIQAPPDNQQEEVPMEIQSDSTCPICMLEYHHHHHIFA